jgi:anti-sigma regulatory factor (Ser/Thr protein kinase)
MLQVEQPAMRSSENSRRFDATPAGSRAARQFVIETCRQHGLRAMAHEAAIVVTELATNAVTHARTPFVVVVALLRDVVRISVQDASPAVPVPREPELLDTSGRGLALVSAVATKWGVELGDTSKVVWAELQR